MESLRREGLIQGQNIQDNKEPLLCKPVSVRDNSFKRNNVAGHARDRIADEDRDIFGSLQSLFEHATLEHESHCKWSIALLQY